MSRKTWLLATVSWAALLHPLQRRPVLYRMPDTDGRAEVAIVGADFGK